MDRVTHDSLELVIEAHVIKLLAVLPVGWPPAGVSIVRVNLHGTAAVLRIGSPESIAASERGPDPLQHRNRSPCQRHVLAFVLREVGIRGRRLTGAEVKKGLHAEGRDWGDTTIERALAELVADGLLANDHDGRGYGPPELDDDLRLVKKPDERNREC